MNVAQSSVPTSAADPNKFGRTSGTIARDPDPNVRINLALEGIVSIAVIFKGFRSKHVRYFEQQNFKKYDHFF